MAVMWWIPSSFIRPPSASPPSYPTAGSVIPVSAPARTLGTRSCRLVDIPSAMSAHRGRDRDRAQAMRAFLRVRLVHRLGCGHEMVHRLHDEEEDHCCDGYEADERVDHESIGDVSFRPRLAELDHRATEVGKIQKTQH